MRATAQKLGRVLCRMLCCVLVGGFRVHPSLKTTCTDFGWGGVKLRWENRPVNRPVIIYTLYIFFSPFFLFQDDRYKFIKRGVSTMTGRKVRYVFDVSLFCLPSSQPLHLSSTRS
jgi:hypothetical protein